jgi:hypothetical protein
MYWQVPRYQLVAVAGWGHAMRAAFLDIDDFLVLPNGQQVTQDSHCLALQTSQLDMLHQLHWEATLLPPGAVITVSKADSSDGSSSSSSDAPSSSTDSSSSSSRHPGAAAVLRVPRFDTLIQPGGCSTAAECLQAHTDWHEQPGTQLAVSTCPVEQGGVRASRRPVVSPHEVVAMRIYTASPRGGRLSGPNSPPSCAYLLHITNLMGPAKPWGHTVAAEWQGPSKEVHFKQGSLPTRQSLAQCQQLPGGSGQGAAGAGAAGDDAGAIGVQR